MKTRVGFISNSSSSSFVILKNKLTEEQLDKIRNHIICAKEDFPNEFDCADCSDQWSIIETEQDIQLETFMDNFDMFSFLTFIGIEEADIGVL